MRQEQLPGIVAAGLIVLLALTPAALAQTMASPAGKAPAPTRAALASNQFAKETDAKAHCPDDTVVWANRSSKIFHYSTSKSYGKGKSGAYMCEKDTAAMKYRAAKNEKHP
jgi:hypothetical protein